MSDLAGVSHPLRRLVTEQYWIAKNPRVTTDRLKILRENKRLFGMGYGIDEKNLTTDVDEVFKRDDLGEEVENDYCFTIAPPYLEKDDEHMVYENDGNSKHSIHRFKSAPQLSQGYTSKWDSKELVSEKILDRQQVKDVRGASQRLLDYTPQDEFHIGAKAQQNPIYRQSVYGAEASISSKKSSIKQKQDANDQTSNLYIPRPSLPKYVNPGDFLFGKDAYQHYVNNKRELDRIEKEEIEPQIALLRRRLIAKRDQIEEVAAKSQEYYNTVYKPRPSLKERFIYYRKYLTAADFAGSETLQKGFSQTDVRARLESLTFHTPWVIFMIIALQAISMSILCSMAGLITPRLTPLKIVVDDIMTWGGVRSVSHFVPPNMWGGPSQPNLIRSGALYAPCLRKDKARLLKHAVHEAESSKLGCCEANGRGAGTTTEQECTLLKGLFKIKDIEWKNVTCSSRSKTAGGSGVYVPHDFKPCCLATKGDCMLVSHKHCVVLGGVWHISDFEHCSQANCDGNLCQVYESSGHVNVTNSTSQFWRLPLSVVFHEGIVSAFLFGLVIQGMIGGDVERLAGWFRMIAIYIICGMGGLLFGSIIVPYVPNVGSGGAICGLLSILGIELVQSWPLVAQKLRAVAKILTLFVIMFASGLFPGINQFTNIAGAIFGVLCSLSFVPYIAFTERHRRIMIILRIVSSISLVIATILLFYAFYVSQPNYEGTSIRFLNCLAFINYTCDENLP